jgi:gamma-glutamylcyclotransferase (GGCT)/AIG2-like uncharacterized protein YtfP
MAKMHAAGVLYERSAMKNVVFNIPNPYPANRYVFVYGTLRRGDANDISKLKPAPRYIGDTQISGKMYHLGGYPGITLDANSDSTNIIIGEVYQITEPLERILDGIESEYPAQSDEYYKRDITVVLDGSANNLTFDCIVYEINSAYIQGKKLIASGDWVKHK